MNSFGPAALIGLCIGFMWGIGCSLAILYSIFLGGYRKGVEDSLAPQKSARYRKALERVQARMRSRN
jgi:hypothetical protein